MSKLDLKRSLRLGRRVRARRGHCFNNAFNAWRYAPQRTKFVVGYLGRTRIWHGWLETRYGVILDPTQRVFERSPLSLAPGEWEYRAVRRYTVNQILEAIDTPNQEGWFRVQSQEWHESQRRSLMD